MNKTIMIVIIFMSFMCVMCLAIGYATGIAAYKEEFPEACARLYGFIGGVHV